MKFKDLFKFKSNVERKPKLTAEDIRRAKLIEDFKISKMPEKFEAKKTNQNNNNQQHNKKKKKKGNKNNGAI